VTQKIYRPTVLTLLGLAVTVMSIAATAGFIIGRAPVLPPYLAVHFDGDGIADRWVPPSYSVVLIPVWIQLTLALVFGAITGVLLYRTQLGRRAVEDDVRRQERERMLYTAEAVSLFSAIWVSFQGLSATRLFVMWYRGCCGMGEIYHQSLAAAIVLSVVVGVRAAVYIRHPKPVLRHTEDIYWRFKGLYFNPQDPALFVPLRSGLGWTLNFGRPRAIIFLTVFLIFGIAAPVLILRLLLGE
jgi:uncharacterized membrane protein